MLNFGSCLSSHWHAALNLKEAKYLLLILVACCTMKIILPQF